MDERLLNGDKYLRRARSAHEEIASGSYSFKTFDEIAHERIGPGITYNLLVRVLYVTPDR